ncbi:hypothetical protein B0J12DRAFT_687359 [Macrophomina phaseolina]|uniref:Uncharacterized protein n=1 Tax=Macrophomina phaseolina TaxID=35725 RepID=A0ABQ8FV21_9PEZI|nr:hypothetical protein B0J12DRAFT_687359 [Macrophomina phaseolina]
MTADEVYDTLIAQVILPFYDVVCLFADDFRNHEHVALHITRWAQKARPSTTYSGPRYIVFSSTPFSLDQLPPHLPLFSHIRADIQLQSKVFSYTAQYVRLRDTVLSELDKAQGTKSDSRLHFELRHMAALSKITEYSIIILSKITESSVPYGQEPPAAASPMYAGASLQYQVPYPAGSTACSST